MGIYTNLLARSKTPLVRLSFFFSVFLFEKIGVVRFADNNNDNQRLLKTQPALPLEYGDSCTAMVAGGPQYA